MSASRSRRSRRAPTALVALALAAVTACGSTVQQQSLRPEAGAIGLDGSSSAEGDGLSLPGEPDSDSAAGVEDVSGPAPSDPQPGFEGSTGEGATADGPQQAGNRAPAPGTAPDGDATAGSSARDGSPLRLGLLYVNNDAASSAGVDNNNSFGPRRALEALVKGTNERGGLAGRRVEPTYFELKSSSSSYASDLQAACARFAEDAKTPVVLSFLGITSDQFSSCLAKAGIAHVNGSYGLGDTRSMSTQPTTVSTQALSVDRRSKALLERLSAAGHLSKASRIGVVVEGCPYNQRAVDRTLLPTAKRLGLNVVETQQVRCFGGINDLGGLATDSQNAVLRFSAQNVDRVLVVSSVEANVLLVFTNAAESQGYRPGYALTSLALGNVLKDNVPQQQLAQARGVGWIPAMDHSGPTPTPTEQTQQCVERLRAEGVNPVSPVDHVTVFAHCDAFDLTGQVLDRSRGATAPAAWGEALDAVGTSFRGAAVHEGRTDFSSGRRDGPASGRVFAWSAECSCFRYTGSGFPL